MSKKDALDRYYTRPDVALAIRAAVGDLVGVETFDRVLEPSCGGGAFVDACNEAGDGEVWGVDMDPNAGGLERCSYSCIGDWRVVSQQLVGAGVRFDLAIGNPPFGGPAAGKGRNPGDPAYLGAHHMNAAARVSDVVAFLLPWSWMVIPLVQAQLVRRPDVLIPIHGRAFEDLREAAVFVSFPGQPEPAETRVLRAMRWSSKTRSKR